MQDISPDWKGCTSAEYQVLNEILKYEATPYAIVLFAELQHKLGDYWYWFTLSTLWVSYSGYSDLGLWRKLFRSGRSRRKTSLMKPSELVAFDRLPANITAYRAHRPHETDWISYTLDKELAERWMRQRSGYVMKYSLKKENCLALFLRRGESEILMLDATNAKITGG
ncbi:hypothetical protein KQR54_18870 [Mycobacterium gordonae]|nr:hypothetical protein [Mycobacterium gordonae]